MNEELTEWLRTTYEKWSNVIMAPTNQMSPSFQPDGNTVWQAILFWLLMVSVGFILSTPMALMASGGVSEKTRAAFVTLFSLILAGITVLTFHFPFTWFDGNATLAGSVVTYIYAWGPYIPFQVFGSLIFLAGIPGELRKYAINPATSSLAVALAVQHREASLMTMWTGILCVWGVQLWGLFVVYKCMSFTHSLDGLEQHAKAIGVSFLIFMPVSVIIQRLSTLASPVQD